MFLKGGIAANIHGSLLTISGSTVFDVRTIFLLISRGNGNPREKGESNHSDMTRCIVNEYKPKHLHALITADKKLREFFYVVHVNLSMNFKDEELLFTHVLIFVLIITMFRLLCFFRYMSFICPGLGLSRLLIYGILVKSQRLYCLVQGL